METTEQNKTKFSLSVTARDNEAKVDYEFNISFYIYQDGSAFVAYYPSLELATSANSFDAAAPAFYECFQLFIETCVEWGTLEEVLSDLGWKRKANKLIQPSFGVLSKKPEMKKLLSGNKDYSKVSTTLHFPPRIRGK